MNVWHDSVLNGLELHHATYITHTFARHAHDYYVIGVIEAGAHALTKHLSSGERIAHARFSAPHI